jgi:hypothetical protein
MRRVTLKVFTSEQGKSEPYVFHAPPGRQFTDAGAADLVLRFLGQLNKTFPGNTFRVVTTGRGQYNVIPETTAHA